MRSLIGGIRYFLRLWREYSLSVLLLAGCSAECRTVRMADGWQSCCPTTIACQL